MIHKLVNLEVIRVKIHMNTFGASTLSVRYFICLASWKAKRWANSLEHWEVRTWEKLIEKFMKKFILSHENARWRKDIMIFHQKDRENLYDVWSMFKQLVKACPPWESMPSQWHSRMHIDGGFLFWAEQSTQQTADVVFVGGMLKRIFTTKLRIH